MHVWCVPLPPGAALEGMVLGHAAAAASAECLSLMSTP